MNNNLNKSKHYPETVICIVNYSIFPHIYLTKFLAIIHHSRCCYPQTNQMLRLIQQTLLIPFYLFLLSVFCYPFSKHILLFFRRAQVPIRHRAPAKNYWNWRKMKYRQKLRNIQKTCLQLAGGRKTIPRRRPRESFDRGVTRINRLDLFHFEI